MVDFGFSKIYENENNLLKTRCGTPYYVAPEIVNREPYDSKCDMWSLGVILYNLMSGYRPFDGNNRAKVFDNIKNLKYHFNYPEFNEVSEEVKDLIKKLLVLNPTERLSAKEAL